MKQVTLASAIGIAGVLACLTTVAKDPVGRKIKPCVTISGPHSDVMIRQYHRITSDEDWTRIWQEHMGKTWQKRWERVEQGSTDPNDLREPLTFPVIDFDNYLVIAIFHGDTRNCIALTVASIHEEEERIIFRYERVSYQTARIGRDDGEKVSPYGLFVLPRSAKPVVVEENVQNLIGQPPVWKQCITFAKLVPFTKK
jgi:hypothetical protein